MTSPIMFGTDEFDPDIGELQAANSGADMGVPGDHLKPTRMALAAYRVQWGVSATLPPSRIFVLGVGGEGIFPVGKPSVLGGVGGMFKSALMALIGMHVATGRAFADLDVAEGATLLISCEDDTEEVQRRFAAIAKVEFAPALHALIEQRLRAIDLAGKDGRLTALRAGQLNPTGMAEAITEEAADLAVTAGVPVRLIVIDHARLVTGGDLNDSEAVTLLLNVCTAVALTTGAAVVLLCHSPKSALNTAREEYGAADVLGSGAFVDNARCAVVNTALNDTEVKKYGLTRDLAYDYFAMRIVKSNYSKAGRVLHMKKTAIPGVSVAYPKPVVLAPPLPVVKAPGGANAALDQRVLDAIKADPGRYTHTKLKNYAGKGGRLQASARDVVTALGRLVADGKVLEREPTDAEVAAFNVRKRDRVLCAAP